MSSTSTVLKASVGHLLASAVLVFGTLFVVLMYFMFGLMTAPGGIENPAAAFIELGMLLSYAGGGAVTITIGALLVSVILQVIHAKRRFPRWLPVIVIPLLNVPFLLLSILPGSQIAPVALTILIMSVYFCVYWVVLTSTTVVLDLLHWLMRSVWRQRHLSDQG